MTDDLLGRGPALAAREDPPRPRPVRVSYFDPRTGEPCDSKPEPLRRVERKTLRQLDAEREAALREGAEIAERMERRKAKKSGRRAKAGSPGKAAKPVTVDGVRYASIAEASRATGAACSTLAKLAKGGAPVSTADIKRPRPVTVDGVEYPSIAEAARSLNHSPASVRKIASGSALKSRGASGRPVVVDGKFYPTARRAAEGIGCAPATLTARLRAGGGKVKGHDVRYAEGES